MKNLPLHRLNEFGWFRPSPWLYLCLVLLSRTWLLLIAASASREHGAELLELFYPNRWHFYCGLGLGMPALCILWLQGLRHRYRWISKVWRYGYKLVLATLVADIGLQFSQFQQQSYPFAAAVILLFSGWALLYVVKSRSSKLVFSHQGQLTDDAEQ